MTAEVGRYAPSPTGPLHFGSLLAAVASFCQARGQGGRWHLRIDDLDAPRAIPGADRQILETLSAFGLVHDGPVVYQSRRRKTYFQWVAELKATGYAFDCGCTRREAAQGPAGIEGPIYPGTCRNGLPKGREARSVRAWVTQSVITLNDQVQGEYKQNLSQDIGDFVIRRADDIVAYQLATVVDDAAQGVTEVVRGADLLSSTPRQIWLQHCLGISQPAYAHIPLLVGRNGSKLGKSSGARPLEACKRSAQLCACLRLLGQEPPGILETGSVARVMRWAVDNWSLQAVPKQLSLCVEKGCDPPK